MSFAVFADGSANLPQSMLDGITLLPCRNQVVVILFKSVKKNAF